MKKIAIVSNTSWSLFNFRRGLARSFKSIGYEIIMVAPYDEYSQKLEEEFEYHPVYMNNKGTNPREDIKTTIAFYRLYKQIKPDIILHYTIKPNVYGTIAASMLKIPAINNIAGLGTLFVKQSLVTKIAKVLYKYSQSKAKHIFFQNNDDHHLFISEKIVNESKTDVLPGSGIDVTQFLPQPKDNNDTVVFLLIARMLWEKGVGEFVEAAKIIKSKHTNVEFQLLGFLDVENRSAISREQMQNWVDDGYVSYLGTTDNVQKFIAKADCVVLPSYYREGTPRTLLESASMAKPIITTDNVGCRDVVDHGVNGFLCQVRDAKDLAEKIDIFIALPADERTMMGTQSRDKMIREFDENIVIQKYNNMISTLI